MQLDRKRYMDFAVTVAASPVGSQPIDERAIAEMHQKWPEMIEITNRVASVQDTIFETSKVNQLPHLLYIMK